MDLFTYLMAKNGNNSSVHGDLFSYLLGKSQSQIYTATGVTINIPDAKKLVSFMMTKESTQDGTPTPESPVEVKTVKGSVNVKVVGKNLLNYNSSYIKRNDFVSVSINNNNIEINNSFSGGNTGIAYFIPVEVGKTITISYDNISDISAVNNRIQYEFYDEPLTSITSLPGRIINRNNKYITTTATKAYLMVLIRVDNGSGYVLSDLMVSYQDDKVYELYKESIIPIPLNNNELVGIGDYKDELKVDKSGNVSIEKNTAKIDSYNGETITTTYMSTTGGLDTGATVYYGIDTPNLIDLQTTVDLSLFKGVNNVSNSEDGYMTIEYH